MTPFFKNSISLKMTLPFLCAFVFFTPISFDVTEKPITNAKNKFNAQQNSLSTLMQKSNNMFEIESTPTADPSASDTPEEKNEKTRKRYPEELALEWLIKNQEPEGYWDTKKHEGKGTLEENLLATSFSLISFLSAGHTSKVGKRKKNVAIALAWVAQQQKDDGSWNDDNFLNAICSIALAEATSMGCSLEKPEALKEKATLAITYLLKQQNSQGFFGQTKSSQNDMFVTSWCVMALESAKIANILKDEIEDAFVKCSKLLDETSGTSDNGPESKGLAWSTPGALQDDGTLYQAAAMIIRTHTGWKRNEPWLKAAMKGQFNAHPTQYKDVNPYHALLSTMATFKIGTHWRTWKRTKHTIFYDAQRLDGEFIGSWDPNNATQPAPIDRITYTAIFDLIFEIHNSRWPRETYFISIENETK